MGGGGGRQGATDEQIQMRIDHERDMFDRGQAEGSRRYDQDFAEGARRFGLQMGEDTRRFGLGQQRQEESIARGLESGNQMESLYGGSLPELQGMEEAIIAQSTPGQEQARQATIASLAKQGVRGPQAALETSRQAGMMGQQMQNQLAQLRFQEAMDRRGRLGSFRGARSLQGLGGQG
tara:strand:- start:11119 stop:11652 length:534 start_codon:yes stop_codon:yes gene_type:complete